MSSFQLTINEKVYTVSVSPNTPLLWVLRDHLDMTGTKFGCGKALCGACTVHVNGNVVRSCVLPVSAVGKNKIVTIEGLSSHPVQTAWIEEQVPQCGYCQSGQVMAAVALLAKNSSPDDKAIDNAMSGNICRCGTYPRIRKAIKKAAASLASENSKQK